MKTPLHIENPTVIAESAVKPRRDVSLDIIRCIALLLVVSVHSFSYTGYYSNTVAGEKMFLLTVIRSASMMCVPLFIMLSGYLMYRKTVCRKYYSGIVRTLGIYLLASICCMSYSVLFLNGEYTFKTFVFDILSFSGAEYSWYIEMYIGLFLIIPFLNLAYNGLTSQKQKLLLLMTMLFMTALPGVLNNFDLTTPGFWTDPASSSNFQQIIPDWWICIYPITYYFAGCYLREFGIGIKLRYRIPLFLLSVLVIGGYSFYRCYGGNFLWQGFSKYESLLIFIPTVLLFSVIKDLNTSNMPHFVCTALAKISDLCLGGYLVSYIFDDLFYRKLKASVPLFCDRIIYMPLMILLVYVSSLILSFAVNLIYDLFSRLFSMVKKQIKKV